MVRTIASRESIVYAARFTLALLERGIGKTFARISLARTLRAWAAVGDSERKSLANQGVADSRSAN